MILHYIRPFITSTVRPSYGLAGLIASPAMTFNGATMTFNGATMTFNGVAMTFNSADIA